MPLALFERGVIFFRHARFRRGEHLSVGYISPVALEPNFTLEQLAADNLLRLIIRAERVKRAVDIVFNEHVAHIKNYVFYHFVLRIKNAADPFENQTGGGSSSLISS